MRYVLAIITIIVLLMQSAPAVYYVAPYGVALSDGSADSPRTLASVLCSGCAQPGATIWLMPGTYTGPFVSSANGTAAEPITIRSVPGTRARLDGKLDINGAYTTWSDIELTYTGWTTRTSAYAGGAPPDMPNTDLYIIGPGTRIEHSIIHDIRDVGWWQPATDSAFVDTLIYDIGWQGKLPDRGHGHGLYTQNTPPGGKLIQNVISWGNYSTCGKIYGATANLKSYTVDGLTCGPSGDPRFLVGSETGKADAIVMRSSLFFGSSLELSNYNGGLPATGAITVTDSLIAAPAAVPLAAGYFKDVHLTGNTIIGGAGLDPSNRVVLKTVARQPGWVFDQNAYFYTGINPKEIREESIADRTFAQWQALGMDAGSTITRTLPMDRVFVRPTRPHHGQVIVYNWTQAASVSVDLSALALTPGATYHLTNAQNPAERQAFIAGAPVVIPMSGWTTATPFGASAPVVAWDSRFGVWLVEP